QRNAAGAAEHGLEPAINNRAGIDAARQNRFNAATVDDRRECETAGLNILICAGADCRAGCGPTRHYLLGAAAGQHCARGNSQPRYGLRPASAYYGSDGYAREGRNYTRGHTFRKTLNDLVSAIVDCRRAGNPATRDDLSASAEPGSER